MPWACRYSNPRTICLLKCVQSGIHLRCIRSRRCLRSQNRVIAWHGRGGIFDRRGRGRGSWSMVLYSCMSWRGWSCGWSWFRCGSQLRHRQLRCRSGRIAWTCTWLHQGRIRHSVLQGCCISLVSSTQSNQALWGWWPGWGIKPTLNDPIEEGWIWSCWAHINWPRE